MVEEIARFPVVRRGYDRAQVDEQIHSFEVQLEETQEKLDEARTQVSNLDSKVLRLSGELADTQRQPREADRPRHGRAGVAGPLRGRATALLGAALGAAAY